MDFFRGAALVSILWQHLLDVSGIAHPLYLQLAVGYWGITYQAAGFVFLSGFVFGVVYIRILVGSGYVAIFAKSIMRALQLHAVNLTVLASVIGLVLAGRNVLAFDLAAIESLSLSPLLEARDEAVWHAVTLRYFPYGFDILPLYIALVATGPLWILLARNDMRLLALVSAAMYIAAQMGLNLPASSLTGDVWYFNPFAYQIVFVVGIAFSQRRPRLPDHPVVLAAATAILVSVAVARLILHVEFPLAAKTDLGPLRLAYFGILAFVLAHVTRNWSAVWDRPLLRPLVVIGQHALGVFACGLLLTYIGALIMGAIGPSPALTVVVLAGGLVGSIASAHALQHFKAARRTR